jgi:hypothetical protein
MTMIRLTITPAALEVIQRALRNSSIADPAVYLIEASEEVSVPPDLGRAVIQGDRAEINRQLSSIRETTTYKHLRRRLVPAIYPRKQFPMWHMRSIEGIPFVTPGKLAKLLDGGTLEVAEYGLQLRNADGVVVLPQET